MAATGPPPAGRLHGITGACWPDPDPALGATLRADDVTRLNGTAVQRICMARTEADVVRLIGEAQSSRMRVSIRGTQHSMGGQSITPGGMVIDLKLLNHRQYDESTRLVTCGTGCTWADLIRYLNEFGMSPRTMQSYSSFSVGGTIAVNGHGITTDESLVRSVVSFRLVRWDGSVTVCSREATGEGKELFGLAIGGYGLFGVITEVQLLTSFNAHLELEKISLSHKDFAACWAGVQRADIGLKMARLNVHDVNHIDLFIFRKAQRGDVRTVSKLGRQPRGMAWYKQVMYKWVMPNAQKLRYEYERMAGVAIDWSGALERNTMMYVSADPVAKLYEPLWKVDDTFVLQEFFVPRPCFERWISAAKPIYNDLAQHPHLRLLNTTIRFVEEDRETVLNYSRAQEGMFAFVLYYRLPRTKEADEQLHSYHSRFVAITLPLNGTFYLPYRFHYTHEEMLAAYPNVGKFFQMKETYDPYGLFDSLWLRQYGLQFCSNSYPLKLSMLPPTATALPRAPRQSSIPAAEARHENSFRRLTNDSWMRHEFVEGFLTQIFNLMDNRTLYRMIAKCTWDPANDSDLKVYIALQEELATLKGPVHEMLKKGKALWQLSCQKKELTREVASIVSRLGLVGHLQDMVCVGDHGKTVLSLREALEMNGEVWVVHRQEAETLEIVAERGSLEPVGQQVPWELREGGPFQGVPDACADLVTMHQGLHHLQLMHLPGFLDEVYRVLRPGGLFIVREHDASEELMPMLELAHSVFNAVTNVSVQREREELRHFRSVSQWRAILEGVGFEDTWLYAMECGDPTFDEMLCFRKPGTLLHRDTNVAAEAQLARPVRGLPKPVASVLDMLPHMLLMVAQDLLGRSATLLPQAGTALRGLSQALLSAGPSAVVEQVLSDVLGPLEELVQRLQTLLEGVELQDASETLGEYIPSEIFVIMACLLRKADSGEATPTELFVAGLLKDAQAAMASFGNKGSAADEPVEDVTENPEEFATPSPTPEAVEEELRQLFAAFPMLQDPVYIDSMGFDRRARSAMKERLGAPLPKMAEAVASRLDETAWGQLKQALLEARRQARPPTADLLFGRPSENCWSNALSAILGSPKVRFTGATSMGLQFVGLGDVVRIWKIAQARRQEGTAAQPAPALSVEQAALANVVKGVQKLEPKVRKQTFDRHNLKNIPFVAELVSAKFGYQSLTANFADVTEEVREMYLHNEVLYLEGVDLDAAFGRKFCASAAWDSFRMAIRQKKHELIIEYRTLEPDPEEYMPQVNGLLDFLSNCGLTEQLHVEDGHFTWFKLTEWMQVEMLQLFGQFLETSVWYRFPYTQFLRTYFETLYAETQIVKERHGAKKAYASSGFVMSFVPGLMMTALMGQLQLMALPLKSMPAELGYGAERDTSKLYEQLVVQIPKQAPVPNWSSIHSGLRDVKCLVPGLFVLKAPTQKALTFALLALAEVPRLRVLEVSNQRYIQVRVLLQDCSTQLPLVSRMKGCQVMLQWDYPTDTMSGPGTSVALCVTVPYLLSILRSCKTNGIKVLQIYDFWR